MIAVAAVVVEAVAAVVGETIAQTFFDSAGSDRDWPGSAASWVWAARSDSSPSDWVCAWSDWAALVACPSTWQSVWSSCRGPDSGHRS